MEYEITRKVYKVNFINNYEEYETPLVIEFEAVDVTSIKTIIEALSSHYSGDPYDVLIDGERAVLDKDWGLL